jgi:hypothetical protein
LSFFGFEGRRLGQTLQKVLFYPYFESSFSCNRWMMLRVATFGAKEALDVADVAKVVAGEYLISYTSLVVNDIPLSAVIQ